MTVKRTPKTFLIEKINDLVERFDKISCQYEVKDNSGLHFIKIIPRMYFKNHSLLQEAMMDLLDDFNEEEFKELNSLLVSGSLPQINEVEAFVQAIDKVVPMVMIEVLLMDIRKNRTVAAF